MKYRSESDVGASARYHRKVKKALDKRDLNDSLNTTHTTKCSEVQTKDDCEQVNRFSGTENRTTDVRWEEEDNCMT